MAKKSKRRTIWRFWAKALGEKGSKCDKESDYIAGVRTIIFVTYLVTNCFIVAGVIRHWDDNKPPVCQSDKLSTIPPKAP